MNRLTFPDHESLSRAAAKDFLKTINKTEPVSVCLATGGTPTRTYEILAELAGSERADLSSLHVVKLDEWGGLEPNHPASCEFYLQKHIISPLGVTPERYISFVANATDPELEASRVREELHNRFPEMDLCVLGLGINGHLGFNEPAEFLTPHVHVAKLTTQTQQHPMVKENDIAPTYGLTLGIADLLQSKRIMILVSGQHKTEQLQRLLKQEIDSRFPASFLWLHPNVDLYCDIREPAK